MYTLLYNIKQTVIINEVNGSTCEIKYGVPQGSVLRPILFILYINEICDIDIDGSIRLHIHMLLVCYSHINHGWSI